MVEHVSSNIQFGSMMLFSGVSFFCTIVSTICRYYNPRHVIGMDDGNFFHCAPFIDISSTWCPWTNTHRFMELLCCLYHHFLGTSLHRLVRAFFVVLFVSCINIKRCMRRLWYLGNFLYPGDYFYIPFHTPENRLGASDMRRHIALNLLVPSSLSPPVYVLFSSVFCRGCTCF